MKDFEDKISSNRPYLIRAIYDWLTDNLLTAQLLIDTSSGKVKVPQHLIQDNQIVLNISPQAVSGLSVEDEMISFHTRFSGRSFLVSIPVNTVLAIFARENGQGMAFPEEDLNAVTDHEWKTDHQTGNEAEIQRARKKSHKPMSMEQDLKQQEKPKSRSKVTLKIIK